GGFPGIMMSPTSFLQSPLRWLQAISRYGATTSGGPNFAYDLCVRKVKPEQRAALDLSSWSVAFNGAEPVRRETIEKFAETFAPNGFRKEAFYPCYGLAEATLIVSGGLKTEPPSVIEVDAGSLEEGRVVQVSEADGRTKPLVGCGMALGNQAVVIVDPKTARQCASGEIGEIWISGPSVAQGYWNSVDETEQTFRARIADTGEGLFLRTGDLGFIQDGELYITGRLKDLIVIRGRNLYPHDIELSVESSDATLRAGCGAAFSLDVDGEERLFVVQEVDQRQRPDLDQLIPRIRRVIAEDHEVQAHGVILIKAGSIPKTSSGKIQRHACRAAFIANRFDVVAEWINTQPATVNAVETSYNLESVEGIEGWLAALFAARLGVSVEAIDTSRPVIDYGLDSVAAIEVVHVIENELYISLPVTSLLQSAGIGALASEAFARLAEKSDLSTAVSVASQRQRENVCPLSVGQQALWLLYQAAPESAAYNINGAMKIKGPLDAIRLRHAFQTLVDRHSALRAIFETHDGRPRQRILEHAEVDFRQENASTWDDSFLRDRLADEAHFPFALEKTPPFRVRLVKRSDEEHFLLVVAHHIVTDLWSMTLLLNELSTLYEAPASPLELPVQYVDYVHWQESMLTGAEGKRLRSYWLQQLSGELPALNLPVDKPRPVNQSFRGGSISFDLEVELSHRLRALCNKQRVTQYTVLLAAFQVLLHRYTGQDEFLVGSPSAGRTHAGLASLVGYLVNPVALRADLSSDVTFKAFLNQVQRTVLDALDHQDYPFALLVEQLQPDRSAGTSPLFNTMVAFQKTYLTNRGDAASLALGRAGDLIQLGNLAAESVAVENRIAQFDIVLMAAEVGENLSATIQYNSDIYEAETIRRMVQHYQILLEGIVTNPEQRISQLPLLTDDERQALIEWNETAVDHRSMATVHELFEEQSKRTPDSVAIVFAGARLSYRELNTKSNQMARYLRRLGVGPERLVGICMERSAATIISILGVLKAGGAYLPLDPFGPTERLRFMVADSGA